jgi:hypothetical protein
MDAEQSLLRTAQARDTWTLNGGRDAFDGTLVFDTLAFMFQEGETITLIHAFQEPEFYDASTKQCNVVIFSGDNPIGMADAILKKTGIVVSEWTWNKVEFPDDIKIDGSKLAFRSALDDQTPPDGNTLHLYQRTSIVQIRAAPEMIDLLAA